MNSQRTHDKFYLNETYKSNPKEYYKLTRNEIEKDFNLTSASKRISLLDIGCETGSFLYYLRTCYPNISLSGMDVLPELLARVNDGINKGGGGEIQTFCCDISDKNTLPQKKFYIITMLGVITIFDDYKSVLNNVMSMLQDNGKMYLFSMFNPEDVDVLVRCRKSNDNGPWERGWNCFSLTSIKHYCEENNWNCEVIPFRMPFEIPRHPDDPLRSWTEETKDGLMIINGIQLRHNLYLLKIYNKV